MEKLRFEFVVKSVDDPKTNVCCITSITDTENHVFLIPGNLQPVRLHEAIIKTSTYEKVKNTLQKRHDKRQVWIKMTPEISSIYMDEDGNMQFKGYLLEESPRETTTQTPVAGISEEALKRILESISDKKKDTSKHQNIKKLTEKFVLEKFTKKTTNAGQWLSIFETECSRIGVEEDSQKIEALRLFLEDSCIDWYSSMLIKHTLDSDWSTWKNKFCETYADKGLKDKGYLKDILELDCTNSYQGNLQSL